MAHTQTILLSISIEELKDIVSSCVGEAIALYKNKGNYSSQEFEVYHTREEAAEKLNINLSTLRARTKDGSLKSYKLGGRILYKESDLNSALEEVIFKAR